MIPIATGILATTAVTESAAVDRAFAVLETYDHGSSRGPLVPLDQAVIASLVDATAQRALEQRLIAVLGKRLSPVASEYVCGKLALIGSRAAVPALATLLQDQDRGEAARNALEMMCCAETVQALRESLSRLEGDARLGVIHSLGVKRDPLSIPELCLLLHSPDVDLASAAAAALGRIGNESAAGALRESISKVPITIRSEVADACLVCAERLIVEGRGDEARRLYVTLKNAAVAEHVRAAAGQALARLD